MKYFYRILKWAVALFILGFFLIRAPIETIIVLIILFVLLALFVAILLYILCLTFDFISKVRPHVEAESEAEYNEKVLKRNNEDNKK